MAMPARRTQGEPQPAEPKASTALVRNDAEEQLPPDQRQSMVGDLLQFAGTWEGDDFEECLEAVYASRSLIEF
jgi:hypothetical protein